MSATAGITGFASTLSWNGTAIGELTKIGGVDITAGDVDMTNLTSPDGFEELVPGLLKVGPIEIEGNFKAGDPGQSGFLADMLTKTPRTVVITFPPVITATWTATCYALGFGTGDMTPDGKIAFKGTLRVTGKPTLAITASAGMSALTVTTGTLVPAFNIDTFEYVAHVAADQTSVTVTPTAADHTITVTANGLSQNVVSGSPSSAIALGAAGSRTVITITVQESGKVAKTYTIWAERAAA